MKQATRRERGFGPRGTPRTPDASRAESRTRETAPRRGGRAALAVLPALAFLAAFGPLLAPYDPNAPDLGAALLGPSAEHPLGTDQLGRDVLSRLLHGARLSVGLSAVAVAVSGAAGTALGMLAGRLGGPLSEAVGRAVDALVAVPAVLVGLVLAAILEPGLGALLAAILLVGWTPFARLSYALTQEISAREYVTAAVAIGAGEPRILYRHVLPSAAGPLLAHACLRFANFLLAIAGLSFLGLGAQPPTPEWGAMLAEARPYLEGRPLLVLVPAGAIVSATLGVTVLGRFLERRWAFPSA
jgi:peptide/nickel transport system permease protein